MATITMCPMCERLADAGSRVVNVSEQRKLSSKLAPVSVSVSVSASTSSASGASPSVRASSSFRVPLDQYPWHLIPPRQDPAHLQATVLTTEQLSKLID